MTGATWQFATLGDDGEWHEVPGITEVRFDQEQPDDDPRDVAYRRHDAFDAMVYARDLAGAVQAVALHLGRLRKTCARAEASLRPRCDRPAWQSPYGPARRTH
ncbi:hypothetical protein [Streptomyces sp. NPDC047000]|uniref:hypothetical protein n=1 Tax=Streptomyces sp. NPDC047000 TaxID=3155474 RepID=UPI00340E365C